MIATVPKFKFHQGRVPLLVSMPHVGVHVPPDIAERMTDAALELPDTDWHLERLYDFLDEIGASVLVATHSRYVIDVNRPNDNSNLYPGQDSTGLVPIDTFDKKPVYRPGMAPGPAEVEERCSSYWSPYHQKLEEELQRIRQCHGVALLWDAHSIASVLPRFFEGRLADLNLGTAAGVSCAPDLAEKLREVAEQAEGHTYALNGRFKGGYITRHYGKPQNGIHAVQLEMSTATYMMEAHPYPFVEHLAERVRPTLRQFLEVMLEWAEKKAGN
jgi:N-formylglutamate deformylase